MSKKFIEANYDDGEHKVKVGLILLLWKTDDVYFQYSPELDITGYGKSEKEAKKSFEYVLEDFIAYTLKKGTIFDELEKLGWTTNKKKKRLRAPEEDQLLEDNVTYKDLLNMPGVHRSMTDLALTL